MLLLQMIFTPFEVNGEEIALTISDYNDPRVKISYYLDDLGIISKIEGLYRHQKLNIYSERTEIGNDFYEYKVYTVIKGSTKQILVFHYDKTNSQATIIEPFMENITISKEPGTVLIASRNGDSFLATVIMTKSSIKRKARENNKSYYSEIQLINCQIHEMKNYIDGMIQYVTKNYDDFYVTFDPKDSDATVGQYTLTTRNVPLNPLSYYINNYIHIISLAMDFNPTAYLGGIYWWYLW